MMLRKAALVLMLLAAAIWLASCGGSSAPGGDGGGGGMDASTPLIGHWQPIDATETGTTAVAQAGTAVRVAEALGWGAAWTNATYQFNQNGTAVREASTAGAVVDTASGSWNTDNGVGWMEFAGVRTTIAASTVWGNVANLTLQRGGRTFGLRMARITPLSEHDQQVCRTWRIQTVSVDGTQVALHPFFNLDPDSDALTVQLLPDGTGIARELEEDEVVDEDRGTWVSGSGTAVGDIPPPLDWLGRAIYEQALTVTFFDTRAGATVKMNLSAWAPEDTRDPALIGTWRAVSVTRDGQPTELVEFFEGGPGFTAREVQFWADGSFEERNLAGDAVTKAMFQWWWTRPGGQLFIDDLGPDPTSEVTYAVGGATLTVDFEEDQHQVILTFEKQ